MTCENIIFWEGKQQLLITQFTSGASGNPSLCCWTVSFAQECSTRDDMPGLFCGPATEKYVWRNDILAEGSSVPKTDCTLMDKGHLLMPTMYALLYRSTSLTLSSAPHYPLWNETFIIPWCDGANGSRLSSIPSMTQWPLNHGQGAQTKNSWVVSAAGHCFIRVHQSETKRKCVGFFF